MTDLPKPLERGQRARLFPVLADTSKEGRTLSIFLSCLETVDNFGRTLLSSLGAPSGGRSKIECYTEVILNKKIINKEGARPDGLIIVTSAGKNWTALVEAKVGNSDLTNAQLESYLDLAKINEIDAVITLSNQFAALPSHHPVNVNPSSKKKVSLFHWSWMYVVTQSALQLSNEEITDREQRVILREMNRFLLHESSGVRGFDQMPAAWTEIVGKVLAGAAVSANAQDTRDVIGAWHQELGDLALTLSRQLERHVEVRMTRVHIADPAQRQRDDQKALAENAQLNATLSVPDAAAPIAICADLKKRSITVSMRLRAPDEPKSTKARINWLLRQLQAADPTDVHVRCFWPGRTSFTQFPLAALRTHPETVLVDHNGQSLLSFELLLIKDLGPRFAKRRNFIDELGKTASEFYLHVGENVKAWQARAPRLVDGKAEPQQVGTEALREEAEQEALAGEA